MIKKAPTRPAVIAMVVFTMTCFGLLLYLWLNFGGASPLKPAGYRLHIQFPEATQLAHQGDVRISGVPVGKVIEIVPGTGSTTDATLEIQARYAPLPKDTRAILRLKTLLGETYVELTPGDRRSGMLGDGAALPDTAVEGTVELDEILRTFDRPTRLAFRTWAQSQAGALRGRGGDINAGFALLPGFTDSANRLLAVLDSQAAPVRKLFASTGDFFGALSAREGELRGLIADSNHLFQTTAARNEKLADIFRALPRFERESRLTLPALTAFGDRALPVVTRLQPAADQIAPTFADTARLAPQLRALFVRLGPAVTASERGLPAFERILQNLPPLLDRFEPFLQNVNPIVDYASKYRREITALFANTTAATLANDHELPRGENAVHYLRTAQTLSPQALTFLPHALGQTRANAYPNPGALTEIPEGLSVLDSSTCGNGDPAAPSEGYPDTLTPLVRDYVFRTDSRDVARPRCREQQPAFGSEFPQLRAEP